MVKATPLLQIMQAADWGLIDESQWDFGSAEIQQTNPHRFEMALLSGVIAFQPRDGFIVGVKHVTGGEFWARGIPPSEATFPPVFMIELIGQLCSFYWRRTHPADQRTFALAEIETARFHAAAVAGDRLILVAKATDMNPRRAVFDTAGFIAGKLVVEAAIVGMALKMDRG